MKSRDALLGALARQVLAIREQADAALHLLQEMRPAEGEEGEELPELPKVFGQKQRAQSDEARGHG